MASNACGSEVFPARATSSISPPSSRTSRRSRSESSGRHPLDGAHHLPEVAHVCISRDYVEVVADQTASIPAAGQSRRIGTATERNGTEKPTFSTASTHNGHPPL